MDYRSPLNSSAPDRSFNNSSSEDFINFSPSNSQSSTPARGRGRGNFHNRSFNNKSYGIRGTRGSGGHDRGGRGGGGGSSSGGEVPISMYYHPAMVQDPWKEFEGQSRDSSLSNSTQ